MRGTAAVSADAYAIVGTISGHPSSLVAGFPHNLGLIAGRPAVREHRMAAACSELRRRGYPVQSAAIAGRQPDRTPSAWASGN